ncbi:MAG: hypothetical protein V3V16_05265, partial [Melioribacteraceae bacterium]
MKKVLNKISEKIGFTNTEINVVLFIVGVFMVGLLGKYYNYTTTKTNIRNFDYSEQDSLFFAMNQKAEPNLQVDKNLEIKVDSKRELL